VLCSLVVATLPSALASAATAVTTGGMPMIVHSFISVSRRRSETREWSWEGDFGGLVRRVYRAPISVGSGEATRTVA
jgi:hypothetical protein